MCAQINTEKLIKLVSKYPELYDGKHKHYGDLHRREATWCIIAKELNVKVEACKSKWNILRGGYRRALRNKESGCSLGARKWRFEDSLNFLKDCVMERRRLTRNESTLSDNEEEFITIVKEEPSEVTYDNFSDIVRDDEWMSSCSSLPPVESKSQNGEVKNSENGGEIDSVRHFFLSLAETVKTLPPVVQARVKAEVFRAVNSAELKYLEEKRQFNE